MTELKQMLDQRPDLQPYLFCRGFLVTDRKLDTTAYPFYGNWNETEIGRLFIYVHKQQKLTLAEHDGKTLFLIGHAYNPFTMQYEESTILTSLLEQLTLRREKFWEDFNQLTGVFTLFLFEESRIVVVGDCACMQVCCYGRINDNLFFSSHAQLVGDLCGLEKDDYTVKMTQYHFWKKYGLFLPGDKTAFAGLKRLVPNTFVSVSEDGFCVKRFFPTSYLKMVSTEEEYTVVVERIFSILHRNLQLIALKWERPAISMTGGMDSKTTVACANGLYEKYKFYSYDSMDGDTVDAEAAKRIANAIGVEHTTYAIPREDTKLKNCDEMRAIIRHNLSEIGDPNANDVRKRVFFVDRNEFDIEVKSWISEVGRANYYKKFGLKKMPNVLSARDMTTMYKFFSYNRKQAVKTDQIFRQYVSDIHFNSIFNYDPSDMYLWEFRYGSWGGMVITGEQRISYDITIPYNNRILMNEFLRLPLEDRIADKPHYEVIKLGNPKIYNLGITITNWNETKTRMIFEKTYWYINRALPF